MSIVNYIHELKQAGFTDKQAEIVAEIVEQQAKMIQLQNNKFIQFENKELF